jgi:hypothetical protein
MTDYLSSAALGRYHGKKVAALIERRDKEKN